MKEHLILAKTLNLRETGEALRAHAKNYAAAKAKFDNFAWLLQFERTASQSLARAAGNKVKTQSLIRFTDKLERPYNNYVVINTAARRSKLKDISVPLEVLIHLPTARSLPSPPSVVSKTRVLAYLQSALQSPALAAQPEAEETIQASWNLIFEALGKEKEQQGKQNRSEPSCHLPPPSAPHCECTLLRYHLNKLNNHLDAQGPSARTPYPYIGVSKLSCFQCALYFEAYNACQLGPPFQTRSSYTKVVPCTLPTSGSVRDAARIDAARRAPKVADGGDASGDPQNEDGDHDDVDGRDDADKAIEREMGSQLQVIIGNLLAADMEKRSKLSMSTVDSAGSAHDSPPSNSSYQENFQSLEAKAGWSGISGY